MNIWQRPDFVELCMNAEIGAYEEDPGDDREAPAFLGRDVPKETSGATPAPKLASQHVA